MSNEVPYVGFASDTPSKLPLAKAGDEIDCPECGGRHALKAATDRAGNEMDMILYCRCGEKLKLAAVDGRLVIGRKGDCSGSIDADPPEEDPEVTEPGEPSILDRARLDPSGFAFAVGIQLTWHIRYEELTERHRGDAEIDFAERSFSARIRPELEELIRRIGGGYYRRGQPMIVVD